MNNNSLDIEHHHTRQKYAEQYTDKSLQEKNKTVRILFTALLIAIILVSVMLIYMINEYLTVQNASTQYIQDKYMFGDDQPFFKTSAEAYAKFVLRFITIYGLIVSFGVVSIILRKPWLYLLIIVMSFISTAYFLLL
ncbi:ABC-type uncharacterized transport system fused permease/ATPase subunit [Catalinimonas alkaloidigena]|uniref:hypothetical protein n=1 Tax=Catalinimonas alkaloidigena TaxID=1075417 RepID=UPI002405B382|nr:hypothetical protein [Catalinimonas alkaloidigena]MDF9797461.1 ABC-type uncharacterized transport system fused permease/ATPase subunit [Catalinimonas alkaloidigena]